MPVSMHPPTFAIPVALGSMVPLGSSLGAAAVVVPSIGLTQISSWLCMMMASLARVSVPHYSSVHSRSQLA